MTEKNYTNPHDRGRFGFSESGEYRAPYKFGTLLIAVFIAAGIVAVAITFFIMRGFMRDNMEIMPEGAGIYAMASALAVGIVAVVCTIVIGALARYIRLGYVCKYDANDEKFTLTIGGDIHTIYYKEVQTVHFMPRLALGKKVCGYNVTIKMNGVEEEYDMVFDGYLSEKNTPFNIIRERVEMLRHAEALERAKQAGRNVAGESSRPISNEDIAKAQEGKKDVYDRMAELLGKDAEMPGVSLAKEDRNTSRAARAIRAEQEARAMNAPVIPEGIEAEYDVSKVMEKLSPTVGGYAADMPSIGKDGKVIQPDETYLGEDGRMVSVDDIQSYGTFRAPFSKKVNIILYVIAAPFLVWVLFVLFLYIRMGITQGPRTLLTGFLNAENDILLISAVIAAAIVIIILKYMRAGDEYRYKANGREFTVSKKNRSDERILYRDAKGISYKPAKFLWFDNGYEVEIVTVYGVVKFGYCYPRYNHPVKKEDLPFDIIRRNIERRQNAGRR